MRKAVGTGKPRGRSGGRPAAPPLATPAGDAVVTLQDGGGLAAWRARMGWTLARAGAELGLDLKSVWRIEAGASPLGRTVARLALLLETGHKPERRKLD